jgi:hypothetical protein
VGSYAGGCCWHITAATETTAASWPSGSVNVVTGADARSQVAGDKLVASAGALVGISGEFVVTAGTTGWTTGAGSATCGTLMTKGVSITPGVETGFGVSVGAAPSAGVVVVKGHCAGAAPGDEVAGRETRPRGAHC